MIFFHTLMALLLPAVMSTTAGQRLGGLPAAGLARTGVDALGAGPALTEQETCDACTLHGGTWCSRRCVLTPSSCRASTFDTKMGCSRTSATARECRNYAKQRVCTMRAVVMAEDKRLRLKSRANDAVRKKIRKKATLAEQQAAAATAAELAATVEQAAAAQVAADAIMEQAKVLESELLQANRIRQARDRLTNGAKPLTKEERRQAEEYINIFGGRDGTNAGGFRKIDSRVGNTFKSSPLRLQKGTKATTSPDKEMVNGYVRKKLFRFGKGAQYANARVQNRMEREAQRFRMIRG